MGFRISNYNHQLLWVILHLESPLIWTWGWQKSLSFFCFATVYITQRHWHHLELFIIIIWLFQKLLCISPAVFILRQAFLSHYKTILYIHIHTVEWTIHTRILNTHRWTAASCSTCTTLCESEGSSYFCVLSPVYCSMDGPHVCIAMCNLPIVVLSMIALPWNWWSSFMLDALLPEWRVESKYKK